MHTFFGDADMDIIGLIGLAYLMLMLLGNVILTILQNILPSSAAYPVTYLLNSLDKTLDTIMVQDNGTVEDMNIKEKIFLLMILLTILVVVVVPYLIGAVYYAKIVINQVRQIEEADRAKQKEYEKLAGY
jgi:NADH:ubiquinone oxidoreductase subunit 4 (subunit M)